jgi:site-specific DNA-methyltransferase (adenine-specific)
MPKTNNYIEIAVGVCRVAFDTEYINQFARWLYYNLEGNNDMKIDLNDLSGIKGIGKKTIDRIKDNLLTINYGEFNPEIKLDKNKVYLGDSLKLLNGLKDNSVDLIATDPPYKTTSRGDAGNSGGMLQKDINRSGQVFKNNDIDISDWIFKFYRVLKAGGHCYIMTNNKNIQKYLNYAKKAGFKFIKSLIWNKGNKIMGQYYMGQYEYILFFRKGKGVKINNCGTADILEVANNKTKDKNGNNLHDTEKPVELMDILIKNSSKEGELVLDPFMGVGSTIVSGIKNNRNYIGIEIDKEYYEKSLKRLEE